MTFSDILKSLGEYVTLPGRDLMQSVKNIQLANQVKRVEAPNYTTEELKKMGSSKNFANQTAVKNYVNQLTQSQDAYKTLQNELVNPTANSFYNRVLNISPAAQSRQSGSQLYGYSTENPQGMIISPELAKSTANILSFLPIGGGSLAASVGAGGITGGLSGFASSNPGEELKSTLTGIGAGAGTAGLLYGAGKLGEKMANSVKALKPASDQATKNLGLSKNAIQELGGYDSAKNFASEFYSDAKALGKNTSTRYTRADAVDSIASQLSQNLDDALSASTKTVKANDILKEITQNPTIDFVKSKDASTYSKILQTISDAADENGNLSMSAIKKVMGTLQNVAGGYSGITGDQGAVAKQLLSNTRSILRGTIQKEAPEVGNILTKWSNYIAATPDMTAGTITKANGLNIPVLSKLAIGNVGGTAGTKVGDWAAGLLANKGTGTAAQTANSGIISKVLQAAGSIPSSAAGQLAGVKSVAEQNAPQQTQTTGLGMTGNEYVQGLMKKYTGGATGTTGVTTGTSTTGVSNDNASKLKMALAAEVLAGNMTSSDANAVVSLLGLNAASATSGNSYTIPALNMTDQVESMISSLGLSNSQGNAATLGRLRIAYASANPSSTEGQFEALRSGMIATVARALGEKGTLTDQDVKRAKSLIPDLTDTQASAKDKITRLKALINASSNISSASTTTTSSDTSSL